MSARATRVLVYDPNPLNPYGSELARVLRTGGLAVDHWCTGAAWGAAAPGARPALAGEVARRSPRIVVDRLVGTLRFGPHAVVARRSTVVLAWTPRYRGLIAGLVSCVFGPRTIWVDHNPTEDRQSPRRAVRVLHRALRRYCSVRVVHHEWMVDGAAKVVTHPSYRGWSERYQAPTPTEHGQHAPTALYFGRFGAGKGGANLPEVAAALDAEGVHLLVAGRESEEMRTLGEARNVDLALGPDYLTDVDLGRMLSEADVVVAPYDAVTTSGSIIMALSMGCAVVAYARTAGTEVLLPSIALVPLGDATGLAEVAAQQASAPKDRASAAAAFCQGLDEACWRQWSTLLGP